MAEQEEVKTKEQRIKERERKRDYVKRDASYWKKLADAKKARAKDPKLQVKRREVRNKYFREYMRAYSKSKQYKEWRREYDEQYGLKRKADAGVPIPAPIKKHPKFVLSPEQKAIREQIKANRVKENKDKPSK